MIESCAEDRHDWGPKRGPYYDEIVNVWWMESRCEHCLIVHRWPVPDDSIVVAHARLAIALREAGTSVADTLRSDWRRFHRWIGRSRR